MALTLPFAILIYAMILVDEGGQLRVITQTDHARFASELLSLWRANGLPDHPRRSLLLLAVREHDNGWREADAAPGVDSLTARPHDFTSYPELERLRIWKRAILRYADRHPYVALLIAEHAAAVHQPLTADWQELMAEIAVLQREWLDRAALDEATIRADYRFLQLADSLSLLICAHRVFDAAGHGLTVDRDGDDLLLEPFPLAGATTFEIPVRWVAQRPFATDSEFASALIRARWSRLEVRVRPF
jgi:hypothetical protein